jgi:hypothetical protein
MHDTNAAMTVTRHKTLRSRIPHPCNVIDHVCPDIEGCLHHLGFARIDRNRGTAMQERLDHRDDPCELVLHGNGQGAWARRLAANIDDLGPLLNQIVCVTDR